MVDYMLNIKKFCGHFYDENPSFFKNKDGSQKPKPVGFRPLNILVLNNAYNIMSSIYKQAYLKCQHNQKHIAHGVFNKYILDNSWLKRFCEAKSIVVFANLTQKQKTVDLF
jgi:hypothetical protein